MWSFKLKFTRSLAPSLWLIALLPLLSVEAGHHPALPGASTPAYLERGRRVQARFENYSKRLTDFHRSLAAAVGESGRSWSPLRAPGAVRHGYQVLPTLPSDIRQTTARPPFTAAFSWPWTDRLIEQELRSIVRAEADLNQAKALVGPERSRVIERLEREYLRMAGRHQSIDTHIKYNWFWQAQVAAHRRAFDRETALYSEILERQKIAETRARPPLWFQERIYQLNQREAALTRNIQAALNRLSIPSFVRLERRGGEWLFRVSLYTDIDDQGFVDSVKRIIERKWQAEDGENKFRVELDVSYIPTQKLYRGMDWPRHGEEIDILRHVQRFPSYGAILTTGALTTHVQNHAIVLGPHPVTAGVLAHEFGHVLGFRDRYVRGYREIGRDGFQIMEIVSDPGDIMAVPESGAVLREHFELLLASKLEATEWIGSKHKVIPARNRSSPSTAASPPSSL